MVVKRIDRWRFVCCGAAVFGGRDAPHTLCRTRVGTHARCSNASAWMSLSRHGRVNSRLLSSFDLSKGELELFSVTVETMKRRL